MTPGYEYDSCRFDLLLSRHGRFETAIRILDHSLEHHPCASDGRLEWQTHRLPVDMLSRWSPQALSKRIHYGKFVAEAKFRSQRATYAPLIKAGDAEGIMDALTDRAVELKVGLEPGWQYRNSFWHCKDCSSRPSAPVHSSIRPRYLWLCQTRSKPALPQRQRLLSMCVLPKTGCRPSEVEGSNLWTGCCCACSAKQSGSARRPQRRCVTLQGGARDRCNALRHMGHADDEASPGAECKSSQKVYCTVCMRHDVFALRSVCIPGYGFVVPSSRGNGQHRLHMRRSSTYCGG